MLIHSESSYIANASYNERVSVDIDLVVDRSADGKWIRERIPARVPNNEVYELANSPMLVKGLAADDQIRLERDGQFELVRWGGNVAIQVYGEWGEVDALAQHIASIGGRLDGKEPRMRVFTVPLQVGLHRIESTVDTVVKDWPALSWMFGNLVEIELFVGVDDTGAPIHEHLSVLDHGDGVYELAASPLLASGLAAADKIRLSEDGGFELVHAGGNLAVQAFGNWELTFFEQKVEEVGGRLDALAGDQVAVFTFPPTVDRVTVEELFASAQTDDDTRTWQITNP